MRLNIGANIRFRTLGLQIPSLSPQSKPSPFAGRVTAESLFVKMPQMQPAVIYQLLHDGVLLNHALDSGSWRIDGYRETQWLVHPLLAIVQGLFGQADSQIPAVAFENTDVTAYHVVQHFVAAAEAIRIASGRVVLPVDLMRNQHRCSHQQFQNAAVWIVLCSVVVQE